MHPGGSFPAQSPPHRRQKEAPMPKIIDRRQRRREVRDCLASAQVPPRPFFALYLGLVTVIDLLSLRKGTWNRDDPH